MSSSLLISLFRNHVSSSQEVLADINDELSSAVDERDEEEYGVDEGEDGEGAGLPDFGEVRRRTGQGE